jgi:hypothetical protein
MIEEMETREMAYDTDEHIKTSVLLVLYKILVNIDAGDLRNMEDVKKYLYYLIEDAGGELPDNDTP